MRGRDSWVGVSSQDPRIHSREAERHQEEAAHTREGLMLG